MAGQTVKGDQVMELTDSQLNDIIEFYKSQQLLFGECGLILTLHDGKIKRTEKLIREKIQSGE